MIDPASKRYLKIMHSAAVGNNVMAKFTQM